MCSLINKQLLLTAYAYLFIMEQQKGQQGSEALQMEKTRETEALFEQFAQIKRSENFSYHVEKTAAWLEEAKKLQGTIPNHVELNKAIKEARKIIVSEPGGRWTPYGYENKTELLPVCGQPHPTGDFKKGWLCRLAVKYGGNSTCAPHGEVTRYDAESVLGRFEKTWRAGLKDGGLWRTLLAYGTKPKDSVVALKGQYAVSLDGTSIKNIHEFRTDMSKNYLLCKNNQYVGVGGNNKSLVCATGLTSKPANRYVGCGGRMGGCDGDCRRCGKY